MFEFTAKRQRAIASFFCLSLSLVITVGCGPKKADITMINDSVKVLISLLEVTKQLSTETSASVNVSYQDLGEYIRSENLSNSTIEAMETQYSDLSTKYNKLTDTLDQTERKADELFSLLKDNADVNKTPEFKAEMLKDISLRKQAFKARTSIAQGVSAKLKTSVQKYKDILGYFQNKAGTEMIPSYIKEVDEFIAQAKSLDQEVQIALGEGQQIVEKFDKSNKPESTGTTIAPTAEQTTPQTEDVPLETQQ